MMSFDQQQDIFGSIEGDHSTEQTVNQSNTRKQQPIKLSAYLQDIRQGNVVPVKAQKLQPAPLKVNHNSPVPISTQLEFFPLQSDFQRITANALSRSSLFTINARPAKGEPREIIIKKTQIYSLKGCVIHFSGEVLDQYDYDVFMAILHLYNNLKCSDTVQIVPLQLLEYIGSNKSQKDYIRLEESLTRLVEANIHVEYLRRVYKKDAKGRKTDQYEEQAVKVVSHLLSSFKRSELINGHKRLYDIKVDAEISKMFTPGTYSSLNWSIHQKLTSLAKYLNHFYATHRDPLPYGVEVFKQLTRSRSNNPASFKQALAKALTELQSHGLISRFTIKNNIVFVTKV